MITKAGQHDTDRKGRLILAEILQKLNFVANPTTDDYGIDYNVQAFDGRHPTGAWFHVQLKSSERLSYTSNGKAFAYSIDLDHLAHYARDLKQPIFIMFVDVSLRRLFFFSPQLAEKDVREAERTGQQNLTIKVPVSDELPQNAQGILDALNRLYVLLAARELVATSISDFQGSLGSFPNQRALHKSIQDKNDLLKLHRVAEDFGANRFEEAHRRASALYDDVDASVSMKFHAATQLNSIEWAVAINAGRYGPALTAPHFEYARRLCALAVTDHSWLRLASLIVKVSAELEDLVFQDNADHMMLQQHLRAGSNELAVLGLHARRTAGARRILRKYNQGVRLARLTASAPNRGSLAELLPRLTVGLGTYLVTLRFSSSQETGQIFVRSALAILNLGFDLALAAGGEGSMASVAAAALWLSEGEGSEAETWCKAQVDRMPPGEQKDAVLETIRRAAARQRGIVQEGDYNPDPLWQIIEKFAFSMKVDISDEKSLLVRRLRIAVRDENPERHMRFCEHIVVALGSVSPTAKYIRDVFSLDTAANKVVHCNLLKVHEEGVDADVAFSALKKRHCDQCAYRLPRDDEWSYTPSIRAAFQRDNLALVREAVLKGNGLRYAEHDDLEENQ